MKTLIILNDPPYGTERTYNGLRLAIALAKAGSEITLFLLADAVVAAKRGQRPPEGFYSVEKMLGRVLAGGGVVLLCGTCMDARGIAAPEVIEGASRSDMGALAAATVAADKVLVF
ncbi:MAG: DsrE family protein [Alphaproteobacteria bacterium]|nr:DsrE family protein [Alphaproteobacteria bacterium]